MLGVDLPPPGARFHGGHPTYGAPVHVAFYADGFQICAYMVGADPTIGQDAQRKYLTYRWDTAQQTFAQLALPAQPRPLYRPENLDAHPDWRVYVFEREDMVDAFHTLSGDEPLIATTAPGGCTEFELADWGPLYGREVTLWPTHTAISQTEMHDLARRLQKSGAKVSVLEIPQDRPEGWSFHDIVSAGWTWEQCLAFVSNHCRQAVAEVVPIRRAALAVAAPAFKQEPPQQPRPQITQFRDAWARVKGLLYAANGTPYSNAYNVTRVLDSFKGRYGESWFDEFHGKVMTDTQAPRPWDDCDTLKLMIELQGEFGLSSMRDRDVLHGVRAHADRTRRHEVVDWLNGLKWDGVPRLVLMLHEGWGVEAHPYAAAVGRCFLMGAVARVVWPGCQVDYVPVFEGRGDAGKTSSLRTLFGARWFDNPTAMLGDKDFLQNMPGKWCLELGELANLHGRALEVIKATITRRVDTYRASYGRIAGSYPRQCVFAGTIDRTDWNTDEAGGRRWWPVSCGTISLAWIEDHREQLFAEAYERIQRGDPWHDVPNVYAVDERLKRRETQGWEPLIRNYLLGKREVTFAEVMRLALEIEKPKDWSPAHQRTVRAILRRLSWIERADQTWHAPALRT